MRSAYNTGSVSGTGGVSDCAGLQSIGAAITSAATGDYLFEILKPNKMYYIQKKHNDQNNTIQLFL